MPTQQVNDANFYYEQKGQGHPIILISGYTCNYQFYEPMAEVLKQHFTVITFDNRGVGQTKDNNGKLSVDQMADDVIALSEALHLTTPHIIGQSMGGTIAQRVASRYPEKISKLALLATTAKWRRAMLDGMKSILDLRKKDLDFEIIFNTMIPWVFGQNFLSNPKAIQALKDAILSDAFPQSIDNQARQFCVLEDFNGKNDLCAIKANTLIGCGVEDLLSLPFESQHLAQQIQNASLKTFECGHDIPHEATDELNQTLIDFFKSA